VDDASVGVVRKVDGVDFVDLVDAVGEMEASRTRLLLVRIVYRGSAIFSRLAIGYRLCAKRQRLAHKRGGVRHGAGAAGLADVAVDPDAFKDAEAEKD